MTRRCITNFDNTSEEYSFSGVEHTVEFRFEKPDILHFVDNNHLKYRAKKTAKEIFLTD